MSMNWRVKVSSYIQIIGSSSSSPSPAPKRPKAHSSTTSKSRKVPSWTALVTCRLRCSRGHLLLLELPSSGDTVVAIDYLEDHPTKRYLFATGVRL